MNKQYKVSVDDQFHFDLSPEEVTNLDEMPFYETIAKEPQEKSHILFGHDSYSAEILEEDFVKRQYRIKLNGNIYRIKIHTPLDQLITEMGLSLGNDSVEDEIHAPMPGIILEVNVAEGDEVKQGDFLCVLEAMKMENALTAPRDGIVQSVTISQGDTVEKGKLLIELKKND